MTGPTMKAIVVEKYGGIEQLVAKEVPKPGPPEGHDILVKYTAAIIHSVLSCTNSSTE